MIAIMFAGQGAQKVGMGKAFYDKYDSVKEIYNKADELMDFSVTDTCFEKNNLINETKYTQACIYTTNYAMYTAIKDKYKADYFIGLSLGEYNAYHLADGFSFEDGLKVIKRRGEIMQEAFDGGDYGMAAVLGLEYDKVKEIISSFDNDIYIANYNTPTQIVISGRNDLIKEAIAKVKEAKGKALKLKVSGAFHTPLLENASKKLNEEFEKIQINEVDNKVVSNVSANFETDIQTTLVKQIKSEVKFRESIDFLIKQGVDTFIEVGPGNTLTNFVKQINPNVKVINVEKEEI